MNLFTIGSRRLQRWLTHGCAGLLALTGILLGTPASAGTTNDAMQVSVQVLASCILQGANLDFGQYVGQERTGSTQIQVKCQPDVPYHVALDRGQHYNGTYRTIANGPDQIAYTLTQPNGHEWGDSDFDASYHWAAAAPGVANGAWQALTVNGTLFGGAIVAAGQYSDTVLITVHF